MATDIPDYAKDDFNAESDASITFSTYPKAETHRPHVIVVGGGVAGMTAAHRLLERGHDVTLLEANAYLGGKLGAHRDRDEASFEKAESTEPQDFSVFGQGQCNPCTTPCCKTMRRHDWHEHCYHMYLNWYHNFWQLMRDIGSIDRFEPMTDINYLKADPTAEPIRSENPGSMATVVQNMTCGVASPADVFLHSQSMRDLLSTPDSADRRLDQMSVAAFQQEHPYTTAGSRKATHRVLAKAFAAPTAMASAASYKSFLKYGARLPEPTMWLLRDHTENAIFTPWLKALATLSGRFTIDWPAKEPREVYAEVLAHAKSLKRSKSERDQMPAFTLMPLTQLTGIELDWDSGDFLLRVQKLDRSPSPQPLQDAAKPAAPPEFWQFDGQVVMAVPPRHIAGLVHTRADQARNAYYERTLAGIDPALVNTTRLTGAPIMTLDVVFKAPLKRPLPRGIVLLLDSEYEMSIYDNAQMWDSAEASKEEDPSGPHLSICASDAKPLMPFVDKPGGAALIVYLLLKELQRYVEFDPEADIFKGRTHLQTNAGAELFINAVDTWEWRPKTTTRIPDLFIAGDYVQTPIDVVTIEGAAMSGLMAAEAVRRRTGKGRPVPIVTPDSMPGSAMKAAATVMRPMAYAAKMASDGEKSVKRFYDTLFPGGS